MARVPENATVRDMATMAALRPERSDIIPAAREPADTPKKKDTRASAKKKCVVNLITVHVVKKYSHLLASHARSHTRSKSVTIVCNQKLQSKVTDPQVPSTKQASSENRPVFPHLQFGEEEKVKKKWAGKLIIVPICLNSGCAIPKTAMNM